MNNLSWDPTGGKIEVEERAEVVDDGKKIITVGQYFHSRDGRVLVFNDEDTAVRWAKITFPDFGSEGCEVEIESFYDYEFDSNQIRFARIKDDSKTKETADV